jgi:hypothetical protein
MIPKVHSVVFHLEVGAEEVRRVVRIQEHSNFDKCKRVMSLVYSIELIGRIVISCS